MLLWIESHHYQTYVFTSTGSYIIEQRSMVFLDTLCKHYGSTYAGRKEAAARFLHIQQKVPILISMEQKLLMFPTHATSDAQCVWINYGMVESIVKQEENKTLFRFYNGSSVSVWMESRSAKRQLRFCYMFLYQMDIHLNQSVMDVLD